MNNLIGPLNDNFAIYATAAANDTYSVVIYPALPGEDQALAVPAAAFKAFLRTHRGHIETNDPSATPDIFVCALREDDVRDLAVLTAAPQHSPNPMSQAA